MQPNIESFSSTTKGLYLVSAIETKDEFAELTLLVPEPLHSKLLRRFEKFSCHLVSIDGVAGRVTVIDTAKLPISFEVVAQVAKDKFLTSSLAVLLPHSKVSLGMMSLNPSKWLLEGSPVGSVKYLHSKIAEGHQFTKMLTFECSIELFLRIEKLSYIGLNGSGFILRDPIALQGHYYFSVHIGQQTRERTLFGNEDLSRGTVVTLSLPYCFRLLLT